MANSVVSVGPNGPTFNPDTENGPLSGVGESIQTGMKLALAQEQLNAKKAQVEQQKATMQVQAGEKSLTALDNVVKYNGKASELNFNEFVKLQGIAGRAVDPNLYAVISADKQSYARLVAEARANPALTGSPEMQAQFSMLTGNAAEAGTVMQNIFNQYEQSRRAALEAAAQNGRAAFNAEQQKQRQQDQQRFQQAENEKNRASREDIADNRIDMSKDRLDQQVHQRNLQALKKDTALTQRLNQFGNLDNALATVVNAESLTPQQIDEFQQAVRSNLGIKGTGGVNEREKTQINTLGLTADRWTQFLTGDPVSISKDTNLVKHLQDLARVEQGNIRKLVDKRIDAMSAGNKSVYGRRPDLKADLLDATGAVGAQYSSGVPAKTKSAPTAPTVGTQVQDKVLKPATAALIQAAKASGKTYDQLKAQFEAKGFTLKPEDLQ